MPHGMRWAQCCNSVCHARGLQTENELSLQSIPCQNHLFSFAQYSSILPRLVFLRTVFGLLLKKKNPIKKESPELIKSRETCWDFVLQLSIQQKTLCKTNADIFLLSTSSSPSFAKHRAVGTACWECVPLLFRKGRSQTKPTLGTPAQMCWPACQGCRALAAPSPWVKISNSSSSSTLVKPERSWNRDSKAPLPHSIFSCMY